MIEVQRQNIQTKVQHCVAATMTTMLYMLSSCWIEKMGSPFHLQQDLFYVMTFI